MTLTDHGVAALRSARFATDDIDAAHSSVAGLDTRTIEAMLDHLHAKDVKSLEAVVREHNQAALDAYAAYLEPASLPSPKVAGRA